MLKEDFHADQHKDNAAGQLRFGLIAGAEDVADVNARKGQQKGGGELRKEGYRVESIAIVETMDWKTQTIKFRDQPVLPLENTKLKIM